LSRTEARSLADWSDRSAVIVDGTRDTRPRDQWRGERHGGELEHGVGADELRQEGGAVLAAV
jgi:hypothetical protein